MADDRLTLPAYEPGACHIVVDGHRVGFALARYSDWEARLWPIADTRPAVTDEAVCAPRLRDLRQQLRHRLAETGPWWTTALDQPTEETSDAR